MARPRRIHRARLELTPEAYRILGDAARFVLQDTGLIGRRYVTEEDLISIGWQRAFFYLRQPDDIRYLFGISRRAMYRYLRELKLRPYAPINWGDQDDEALNITSGRALDDPQVQAIVMEELSRLAVRERLIVYAILMEGRTPKEMGRQIGRTDERVRQIVKGYRRRMAEEG